MYTYYSFFSIKMSLQLLCVKGSEQMLRYKDEKTRHSPCLSFIHSPGKHFQISTLCQKWSKVTDTALIQNWSMGA